MWRNISWTMHALRLVWTFSVGVFLGWASGSILLGGGLAGVSQKVLFGDWDSGYAWSYLDIPFWASAFAMGAAGAALSQYLGVRDYVFRTVDAGRVSLGTRLPPSEQEASRLESLHGSMDYFDSMT